MLINSQIHTGPVMPYADQTAIKNEPMLHRATYDFAIANGGPLTKLFLQATEEFWRNNDILIDSRVHFAPFNGVYFCIPGFHHDDVPREREDGQPEYFNPSYKAEHVMCIWGINAPTEFALGEAEFYIPELGDKIYKILSPIVNDMVTTGELRSYYLPERLITYFDWLTWHRGTPAIAKGFRFFIRATRKSGLKPRNEIRMNANVYLPILEEGW